MEYELLLTPDVGLRARNEVNFHAMNRHMLGMWEPLTRGGWSSEERRREHITYAQSSLAVEGLFYYMSRQRIADADGSHAMFTPAYKELYERTTGIIQEVDAAIVLLDVVRRYRNLTVVPAPMQFERSRQRRRNVDFVVVDAEAGRAVGIQVKSKVNPKDFAEADKDRVVFVDGDVDLGNVKAMRTQRGKSDRRVVAWPGIIAARRMSLIKTHGKGRTQVGGSSRNIMKLKIEAERLVGDTQVDYRGLSQVIGERILERI